MRYAFDIDGTICTNREEVRKEKKDDTLTYLDMEPYSERIQIVNDLYDQGHEIIYWTGRGGESFKDDPQYWYGDTERQLKVQQKHNSVRQKVLSFEKLGHRKKYVAIGKTSANQHAGSPP